MDPLELTGVAEGTDERGQVDVGVGEHVGQPLPGHPYVAVLAPGEGQVPLDDGRDLRLQRKARLPPGDLVQERHVLAFEGDREVDGGEQPLPVRDTGRRVPGQVEVLGQPRA